MNLFLLLALFLASLLYSSIGLGGGSAYLAILGISKLPYFSIPPIALLLNIIVSGIAWLNYSKAKHFSATLLLPFLVTSIPAAFLGGILKIEEQTFYLVLSLVILISGCRIIFFKREFKPKNLGKCSGRYIPVTRLSIGFGLGFLAGVVGIGGGIFLQPVLLFFGWANSHQSAATSAGFICLNSLAGLSAQLLKLLSIGWSFQPIVLILIPIVILAGYLGSSLGARRFSNLILQRILGFILLIVAITLFSKKVI